MNKEPPQTFNFSDVTLEIVGPIAKMTLCSLPVNAVGKSLGGNITEAIDKISQNSDISVLRIRSKLRLFSAGANLNEVTDILDSDSPENGMRDFAGMLHRINDRIATLDIITIAELQGAAIGGGFELALACDFRLASTQAKVGLPETGLGLIPGAGGTQRLAELAGLATARRLILTCEIIDAETACSFGILDRIYSVETFDKKADEFANSLTKCSKSATAAAKRCLALSGPEGFETEIAEISALAGTIETQKRIGDFLKRSQ